MRIGVLASWVLVGSLLATSVQAQESSKTSTPPSAGQRALVAAIATTPQGQRIVAQTCPSANCDLAGALPISAQPPDEKSIPATRFQVLNIGAGRHVMLLQAGEGPSRWQAVIAAPVGSANEPIVIWSGMTSTMAGDDKPKVQVTPSSTPGVSQVLVGKVDSNLELCGRETLLMPQVVHTDLTLRHVKLQRLSNSERASAQAFTATRVVQETKPLGELLVGIGASSGYGSPGALTDGDPNTFWSEARGAEGRGEFVVMRAPSEVPISAFSFMIRPVHASIEHGASPKNFFLAADKELLRVSIPEDAWNHPGRRYEVRLPTPISTSCLAVVLDDAFVGPGVKDARVTMTELVAHSVFDGVETVESLADALSGEEQKAKAAVAVLMRGGEPAAKAVASRLGAMNASGRHHGMQVLDAADCSLSAPVFASMLAAELQSERAHAKDRIQRCGKSSAQALVEVVEHGAYCAPSHRDDSLCAMTEQKPHRLDSGRLAALNELATVAPERVVPLIAPLLGKMNRPTRRELRLYLSRATKKSRGRLFLSKALLDESLPMAGTVELLRAVQGALGELRGPAGVAFDRVLQGEPNLRTRYLLLESAAQLAAVEHERALHFLLTSLTSDPEPMMRTQAAMVSRTVPAARPWLMRALEDDNVRVRHAAAGSLAGVPEASPYLVRRLMVDDWPLVRASAARALGTSGPSSLVDEQLGRSLQDLSPSVRQWAVASLGARGASRYASAILEIAEEPREKVTIRIAAVHALGMMCASEAVDSLTILAKRSADPYSPEAISGLGTAALASLGRLQPKDLGKRLDPLLNRENISMQIRAAAQAALETTDRCPSK